MPKVISGLKLLVQSDPSVESFQQQTGEHVIVGAGELLLEVREHEVCVVALGLTRGHAAMFEGPT